LNHGDILKTSATAINRNRERYGEPDTCFKRASVISSSILGREITPYEIVLIMHAVKLARIAASPSNGDHYVDGVSYLAFAGEFQGAEQRDEIEKISRPVNFSVPAGRPLAPVSSVAPKSNGGVLGTPTAPTNVT
jgi:Domain of unknown function (DUF6378)